MNYVALMIDYYLQLIENHSVKSKEEAKELAISKTDVYFTTIEGFTEKDYQIAVDLLERLARSARFDSFFD